MEQKTFTKNAGTGGSVLDQEWAYYLGNRDEIVQKYRDKYVVISGNQVVAAYDNEKKAYWETVKRIPLGSFMIHHVAEEEEVYQLSPFANA
jgi:hypothetical protein